eukprot:3404644-Ditylum_brightwellii.AAC.1
MTKYAYCWCMRCGLGKDNFVYVASGGLSFVPLLGFGCAAVRILHDRIDFGADDHTGLCVLWSKNPLSCHGA